MKKRVDELKPGDMVDLQNDRYADPEGFASGGGPGFMSERCQGYGWAYEFVEVVETERETPECVRVDFVDCAVGFPPDHLVEVAED